jgi:hypothetical protein
MITKTTSVRRSRRSSTEKLTPYGLAKARVRDYMRDNLLANGVITRSEYAAALEALNLAATHMRNMDKAREAAS